MLPWKFDIYGKIIFNPFKQIHCFTFVDFLSIFFKTKNHPKVA